RRGRRRRGSRRAAGDRGRAHRRQPGPLRRAERLRRLHRRPARGPAPAGTDGRALVPRPARGPLARPDGGGRPRAPRPPAPGRRRVREGEPRPLAAMIPPGKERPPAMPSSPQPRLLVEERRRKILDLVEKQARVTVFELVKRFGVSAVTVRGDLDALSRSGTVIRSHGGALKPGGAPQCVPINVKETLHHGEKVRIGHAAAQMIRDNEIVMLDSGTTTAEVARHIKFLKLKSLTVITNALNIAMELANLPHLRVIMIGGILRQMSYSLVGPHAEHTLRGLNADRLFLGVDGLDPEIGLTTPDVLEA